MRSNGSEVKSLNSSLNVAHPQGKGGNTAKTSWHSIPAPLDAVVMEEAQIRTNGGQHRKP